jgi:outer membrane protein assembly factor BamB
VRAISVTCPQCGAILRVGASSDHVTCEYCGTPAVVQRRSRVLERPIPPVRAAGTHVPRIAVQKHTGGWIAALIVGTIVVVFGVTMLIVPWPGSGHHAPARAAAAAKPVAPPAAPVDKPTWQGTGNMLIADIDGDGTAEVVGRARSSLDGEKISLVALDGRTGAERWHTPQMATYSQSIHGALALAGDTLLFSDERGLVSAFELATGAARWTSQQPERTRAFCAGPDPATVVVLGTDDERRPIALATGQPAVVEAAPACTPLRTDEDGEAIGSGSRDYELATRLGWNNVHVAVAPDGARLAAGDRLKGTHLAQLAALDADDAPRWKVDLAPDPLAAEEGAPALFEVSDLGPCATYQLRDRDHHPHVACFAAGDGARRWDIELLDDSPLRGMRNTATAVYVSMWNLLEAHDATTGALLWTYGRVPD